MFAANYYAALIRKCHDERSIGSPKEFVLCGARQINGLLCRGRGGRGGGVYDTPREAGTFRVEMIFRTLRKYFTF